MDWGECELVEVAPGKQGGVPLVKRTRIPASQIVEEAELGSSVEEIAENYPSLTVEKLRELLAYSESRES
jgi:uncharacterized protein (DUF433 family)